jgi:hypothetical protein
MNRKLLFYIGGALGLLIIILLLFRTCNSNVKPAQGKPLARVYDNYFYYSDADGIGLGLKPEDSIRQLQIYLDKWIVDQLVLGVAKQNISGADQNKIDRLVEAYKNSLILNSYEEKLINRELDTVITPEQLADYYTQNKDQYVTGQNWVRCHFIKAKRTISEVENIRAWFKSGTEADFEKLKQFCLNKSEINFALEKEKWIPLEKILNEIPGDFDEGYLNINRILDRTDDQYLYLFRIFEFRDKDAPAPLAQIQDEITRIIMQQRRSEILKNLRNTAFEKAKRGKVFEKY